ncbi:MAG: flagellar protein FliT [Nitrospirae bacterium]|nr:flagellar protein FliT [Nitrospirota bacterium]
MNAKVLDLCREILDLAEAQRAAVLNARFDEVILLQEKRQRVMERIQSFDGPGSAYSHFDASAEKRDRVKEEFSCSLNMTVRKILSIDKEIKQTLHQELFDLIEKMETVQKLKKAFCHGVASGKTGKNLNVNA